MKHKTSLVSAFVVAMLILIVGVALAAEVPIDLFNAGLSQTVSILVEDDGTGNPDVPVSASSRRTSTAAIGGERDLILTVLEGQIDDLARWRAQTSSGFYLSLGVDPNIKLQAWAQWDGNSDASPEDLDCTTGLGGEDLTDEGNNDGIVVRVEFSDDVEKNLSLRIYTNCSNWAEVSLDIPVVASGQVVDIFLPFSAFAGGAGTLEASSVNAIEFEIDGSTAAGSDAQIKFIKATSVKEFGDLPSTGTPSYPASIRGAYHISQGLRLGNSVDAEAVDNPDLDALGDDNDGLPDDEDGIVRTSGQNWSAGTGGGHINLTVNGCDSSPCYLNGWIDWTRDGDFADSGEHILDDRDVEDGTTNNVTFNIPDGQTFDTYFFARFRICPSANQCDDPDDIDQAVVDGEIEDYKWLFGPTAVTLSSFSAKAANTPAMALVAVAVFGLALVGAVVLINRRK